MNRWQPKTTKKIWLSILKIEGNWKIAITKEPTIQSITKSDQKFLLSCALQQPKVTESFNHHMLDVDQTYFNRHLRPMIRDDQTSFSRHLMALCWWFLTHIPLELKFQNFHRFQTRLICEVKVSPWYSLLHRYSCGKGCNRVAHWMYGNRIFWDCSSWFIRGRKICWTWQLTFV